MKRLFEDYLERLGALHAQIGTAIEGVPQEALDWVPGAGMNSLSVLVVPQPVQKATGLGKWPEVDHRAVTAMPSSVRTA